MEINLGDSVRFIAVEAINDVDAVIYERVILQEIDFVKNSTALIMRHFHGIEHVCHRIRNYIQNRGWE